MSLSSSFSEVSVFFFLCFPLLPFTVRFGGVTFVFLYGLR